MATTVLDPDVSPETLEDRYSGLVVSFEYDPNLADFHEANSPLWGRLDLALGELIAGVARTDIHQDTHQEILERLHATIREQIIRELVEVGIAGTPR